MSLTEQPQGPDPRLGIQRRSSRIAAIGTILMIIVGILWLTYGFSDGAYTVGTYHQVHRDSYVPTAPPEVLALTGQPPTSTFQNTLTPSKNIRAIFVRPGWIELRSAGEIVRDIYFQRTSTITLTDLTRRIGDPSWIDEPTPGTFNLKAALILRKQIGLIQTGSPSTINLEDIPGVFVALDGRGTSLFSNATFRVLGLPKVWPGPKVPRPFVLFDEGANVLVDHCVFQNLGWDSNETHGLTYTRGASGWISHSIVQGTFIGIYTQIVQGVQVVNNVFENSHLYGIDPHTNSTDLLIQGNTVRNNAAHGIIFSVGVIRSKVIGNLSEYNGENGIVMDHNSHGNTLINNRSVYNAGDGIVMTDSPHTSIAGNTVEHNRIGILSTRSSPVGAFRANTIEYNKQSIKNVPFDQTRNTVSATETGYTLLPLGGYSWIISWLLWPLVALVFLLSVIVRRRELAGTQAVSHAEVLLVGQSAKVRRTRKGLWKHYRAVLQVLVSTWDASHPISVASPVPFAGPPPSVAEPVLAPTLVPHADADAALVQASGDDAGTPPGDRSFRPDVQGVRAIAVTLVVLYHAGVPLISGGFVGVDVFFVVSGFVITGLLLRERSSKGTTSMGRFYARRARRILPAASLVILATLFASYHWLGFLRGNQVAVDGRWASIFLSNYHSIKVGTDYFGARSALSPLLHYWSLAVEEQFYLVFPLLFLVVALVGSKANLRRRLTVVLAIIIGGSLLLSIFQTANSPITAYYSPFTRSWELALGALVAVGGPVLKRIPRSIATALSWFGLLGIVVASLVYTGATEYPGYAVVLPVVSTALVVAAGYHKNRFGAEALLGKWVGLKLGELSFSLYLWHFPVLVIAAEAASHSLSGTQRAELVGLALLLSIATYYLVENPLRHARPLVARRSASIVLGGALVAGTFLIAGNLISRHSVGGQTTVAGPKSVASVQLQREIEQGAQLNSLPQALVPSLSGAVIEQTGNYLPAGQGTGCFALKEETSSVPSCTFGDPSSAKTMVLYGDSQAEMWSSGFDSVAKAAHWRLVILAKVECPPWMRTYLTSGLSPFPGCSAWHQNSIARINALHPSLVFITGGSGSTGSASDDQRGLVTLLKDLRPSGAKISVLSNIPWFAGDWTGSVPPACLAQHSSSLKQCNLPYSTFMHSFGKFRRALATGAAQGGASFLDLDPLLCTTATCPVVVAHHQVYVDEHHMLTTYGAFVAPALEDTIGRRVLGTQPK